MDCSEDTETKWYRFLKPRPSHPNQPSLETDLICTEESKEMTDTNPEKVRWETMHYDGDAAAACKHRAFDTDSTNKEEELCWPISEACLCRRAASVSGCTHSGGGIWLGSFWTHRSQLKISLVPHQYSDQGKDFPFWCAWPEEGLGTPMFLKHHGLSHSHAHINSTHSHRTSSAPTLSWLIVKTSHVMEVV